MCICVGAFIIVASVWYFLSPLHLDPFFFISSHPVWLIALPMFQLSIQNLLSQWFRSTCSYKKTTRCYRMTHSPLALILHTPDVYKCKALLYFLIRIDLPLLYLPSIFGDTHAHLCIHGCRSNRALASNLDPLEHGSRSVEQLRVGPDILTYISAFVLIVGK